MKPDMFFQVVCPLIGVANTALLAISTPQDEFNYFSQLMDLKGAFGEDLFYCYRIGLVCKACEAVGAICNHRLSMNPHWKPPERMAKVDAIMSCHPELRDRETRGGTKSSTRYVVKKEMVEAIRKRVKHDFGVTGLPTVLFSAIDPSGGGSGSDTCIFTIAITCTGEVIVVACDRSSSADSDVIDRMVQEHYVQLRKDPRYAACHVRVYIEANMSFIGADRIAKNLQRDPQVNANLEVVRFDPEDGGRFGVWTGKRSKTLWCEELRRSIPRTKFAEQLRCAYNDKDGKDVDSVIRSFCAQLENFRERIKGASDGENNTDKLFPTVDYTGKGAGSKDDMVAAWSIAAMYAFRDIFENNELTEKMNSMGKNVYCSSATEKVT